MRLKIGDKSKHNIMLIFTAATAITMSFYTMVFMVGFHNFDLGHNAQRLNECNNLTFADRGFTVDGRAINMTPSVMINKGGMQIFEGFLAVMMSAVMLGIMIASLVRE